MTIQTEQKKYDFGMFFWYSILVGAAAVAAIVIGIWLGAEFKDWMPAILATSSGIATASGIVLIFMRRNKKRNPK